MIPAGSVPTATHEIANRGFDGGDILAIPVNPQDQVTVPLGVQGDPDMADHTGTVVVHDGHAFTSGDLQAGGEFPAGAKIAGVFHGRRVQAGFGRGHTAFTDLACEVLSR